MKPTSSAHQWPLIFVIPLYSPSCFGQETAKNLSVFELRCHVLSSCLPHTVESSHCPFLLLNSRQGIEPRSSVSVSDARPLIGANIFFFFIQQKLRYLIATTTLSTGHTLFFCEKGRKKIYV